MHLPIELDTRIPFPSERKSPRLMERGLVGRLSKATINRPGDLDRAQLRIDHGASILQVERSGHIICSPPQFLLKSPRARRLGLDSKSDVVSHAVREFLKKEGVI